MPSKKITTPRRIRLPLPYSSLPHLRDCDVHQNPSRQRTLFLQGFLEESGRRKGNPHCLDTRRPKAVGEAGAVLLQDGLLLGRWPRPVPLPRQRFKAAEKNPSRKECGMIAELPFYATCCIKKPMNQTARDSKEKRQRFKQLAQTQKLKLAERLPPRSEEAIFTPRCTS